MRWLRHSLRLQVLVLILTVALPVAALVVYSGMQRSEQDAAQAREQALRLAEAYRLHVQSEIRGTGLMLGPLASLFGSVRSLDEIPVEQCEPFLHTIGSQARYELVAVVQPDGAVRCASEEVAPGTTLAGAEFLGLMSSAQEWVTAGVERAPVSGDYVVPVAHPIRSSNGVLTGSLVALLRVEAVSPEGLLRTLPAGSFATLVDGQHRIVARFPDLDGAAIGRVVGDSDNMRRARADGQGTADSVNLEGLPSLVGFVAVPSLGAGSAAFVGINRARTLAASSYDLSRNTLFVALVVGCSIVIAWVGTERLVLRPIRRTRQIAEDFGAGDLSARVGPGYGVGDIGSLQRSLDGMSDAIVQRQRTIADLNASLERRVAERTAELEAANNELQAFAYTVSHDLRAPLRAIDGFSQTLQRDYQQQIDEVGRDRLDRIRRAAQRLGSMIDDILQLSRATRVELTRNAVDVSHEAETLARELHEGDPDREVTVDVLPGITADADRTLLRAVLQNLIQNAWKFTSHHTHALIEVGVAETERGRAVYVRDDGAGFEMEYAGKLFGAFQRLHSSDDFEGNGIGLATVQRIIARHGGRVWAEGALEQGATFYFTLPTLRVVEQASMEVSDDAA